MGAGGNRGSTAFAAVRRGIVVVSSVLLALAGLVAIAPETEVGAALPSGFTSTPVMTGLTEPTAVAFSPDGKVYVAEKRGTIRVYPNAASNNGTVFKDLSGRIQNFGDRGLLGLTVDPRLGNGSGHDFVYALYTRDAPPGRNPPVWNDDCPTPPGSGTDGCVVTGTLSRIPVNANGTAGTEQPLIDGEWCQQFSSHSIGHVEFGPDGNLYVSGGDGSSYDNADWGQFGGSLGGTPTPKNPCADPPGGLGVANTLPTGRGGSMRSQSPRRPTGEPRVLNGAILRLNPDTGAGVPGNPMYNASSPSSNASRIIAYGMRNPFRFTTRPGTSEIWVGDVGWVTWEEINRIMTPTPSKAVNLGWPCIEGAIHPAGYPDLDQCKALYNDTTDPATGPYYTYEHFKVLPGGRDTCGFTDGSATSGVAFYSGNRYPATYSNALFFADEVRGCIWVMNAGSNGLPDPSTVRTFVDDSDHVYPVDLETDPVSKDLFFVDYGGGAVNRISYTSSNRSPTAAASATPTSGTAPLTVRLNGSGSSDPDGDTLTYSWDADGNGTFGDATGVSPNFTYTNAGTYQARLLVSDPGGLTATSAAVTITVTSASGPVNTVAPAVSGTAQIGGNLSSTTGTWTGTAPITYARQWQRCTVGTVSYPSAVGANAPWAYWRLGESSGTTAADASGNGRPGTYSGGVGLARAGALSGDANTSAQFDGSDDVVMRNPVAGFPTTSFSTDFWLKTADTTKEAGIVSYAVTGSDNEIQLRDARSLKVYVKSSLVSTGVVLNDGAWHHVAVTWTSSGGAVRVYKDGALAFSGTVAAGATITGGGSFALGQDQDTVGGGFDATQAYLGQLDEVALYPSALTQAQVQAHRQAGLGGGTGTSCADIGGATNATYTPQLADQGATIRVQVTATNGGGSTTARSAEVGPVTGGTNSPPVPVIDTPTATTTWAAGDTLSFTGHANDPEDGTEPASRLTWVVTLGHCPSTGGCHTHPLASRSGVASFMLAAQDHEAPSYIDIALTATDAAGASTTVTRRINPRTVNVTFQTSPAGLSLTVGAASAAPAPFTQSWVVNSLVQMSAPAQQTLNGTTYTLTGWSDGGAATHVVNAPTAATTYTATYSAACSGTTYASAVGANAPWAYWRLGESSGTTAADASGNSRPGTYSGGVGLARAGALSGDANTSAQFDGNDDLVMRNPVAGFPTTAISTDLWLKTTDTTKDGGIISYAASSSDNEFQLRDARSLKVLVKNWVVNTGVVLNDGAWHHVAVTWASADGAVRVYKDGALAFSGTLQAGASLTGGGALVLGQEQDSVGGGFDATQAYLGQLDEVAVYPSALTAAQVQAHRQAGISGGCTTATLAAQRTVTATASTGGGRELFRHRGGRAPEPATVVETLAAPVADERGFCELA